MNQKSRDIVKKLLTGGNHNPFPAEGASDRRQMMPGHLPRPHPVRICGAEEATMMAMVGRKTYTIAQLLRGRYVLRHKGKALRQHKLSSKHRLKPELRGNLKKGSDRKLKFGADTVVDRALASAGVKFSAPLFGESDFRLMEAVIPPQVAKDLLKGSEP